MPQVHYEGNCNPENYGIPSEKNGPIVTDYMAPVLDTKKESFEPYEAPPKGDSSRPHSHTVPPASFKLPLTSYESPSDSKKTSTEHHATSSLTEIGVVGSTHTHETHSEVITGFSPTSHTNYEYAAHAGPSVVLALSNPSQMDMSHPKPTGTDYIAQNPNPAAVAAITSSVSSQSLQNGAESHSHSNPVFMTEQHQSTGVPSRNDSPIKDYAHVHTTFTVPDSHRHEEAKTESHTSKLPLKKY